VDKNKQKAIKCNKQDFNLLKLDISTYIMLGLASFINYSCKFNTWLSRKGQFIQVIIKENIKIKDKITIYYSKDYFYPNVKVLKHNKEKEVIVIVRFKRH
jgi:hypothetical protein